MNIFKRIIAVGAMAAMAVTMLTGCGADVEGKWELTAMSIQGQMVKSDDEQYAEAFEMLECKLEFTDDEITLSILGEDETFEYDMDGNDIVVEDEEASSDYSFEYDEDDDTITLQYDGDKMIFERAD